MEVRIHRLRDKAPHKQQETTSNLDSQFTALFKESVDEIKFQYASGTNEFISKHYPDLDRKIDQAREKIDEIWKLGRQGGAYVDEFKSSLEQWKSFHLEAIKIFKEERKLFT